MAAASIIIIVLEVVLTVVTQAWYLDAITIVAATIVVVIVAIFIIARPSELASARPAFVKLMTALRHFKLPQLAVIQLAAVAWFVVAGAGLGYPW